jgi:hypothetical protein
LRIRASICGEPFGGASYLQHGLHFFLNWQHPRKEPAMALAIPHPLPRPVIIPSFVERLQIETGGSFHCHGITADLQALVERSGVRQGLLVAVGQHTTTALVLNENAVSYTHLTLPTKLL